MTRRGASTSKSEGLRRRRWVARWVWGGAVGVGWRGEGGGGVGWRGGEAEERRGVGLMV